MAKFQFPCSVESSEIDLSEFQEEIRDDGDNGDGGSDRGEAQPGGAEANEPASGNTGGGHNNYTTYIFQFFVLRLS